ncbi:AbrB/MazE/SpoVT family DNA-binding domain-containing protein [bacterium]|nr:AbrB/MazE/SpoVT family DNA-binding domain-containing protein [bacterium]
MEVIVSPKYQVVIPKEVRKQISLKHGQRLQVITKEGIISLIPDRDIKYFRGFLKGMDNKGIREEEERL